ncbi:hypothetical protein ACFQ0B_31960 [Nonomuraea thailandensis]
MLLTAVTLLATGLAALPASASSPAPAAPAPAPAPRGRPYP